MHPYKDLDEKAFWATAVAKKSMFDVEGLWVPKYKVAKAHKIATYGSCFAQHFGNALRKNGFKWMIDEIPPPGLSSDVEKAYNYGVFTSRTGNIYTVSLLQQWLKWAEEPQNSPDEVWVNEGRYYDPYRPNIEPNGFSSKEEVLRSRLVAISSFLNAVKFSDIFVFTLGLTESWKNIKTGLEYPMCPGTVAGEFDENIHKFENQDIPQIRKTLVETIKSMRRINPKLRFLLTVSPVPLTATMSGKHVLVATMESKSILRAVAGKVAEQFAFVDYFPSYEIINSPVFRGSFFEPNQRSVNHVGVDFVMRSFFSCMEQRFPMSKDVVPTNNRPQARNADKKLVKNLGQTDDSAEVICEESLLNAFSK